MRVVHISTSDVIGGAARAAFQLHSGLLELGHESRMLVGYQRSRLPGIDHLPRRATLRQKAIHRLTTEIERRTGLQYLLIPWRRQFSEHPFVADANVIQLHNLHGGYFSHTVLPSLSRLAPLVWTLHDAWPLTGHCTYPTLYESDGWRTGCGNCPALEDYPPIGIDTTALLWRMKRSVYRRSGLTVVAPSLWLYRMARESPLLQGVDVHHVPYGADLSVFAPRDSRAARETLGLPHDKKIVLFAASEIDYPRKGLTDLLEALRRVRRHRDDVLLLTVGDGAERVPGLGDIATAVNMGRVESDRIMAACYAAADVLAAPSEADNLPNSVLESLASGLPVVAYDVGGMPDMVRPGETGSLVPLRDVDGLAGRIVEVLSNHDLRSRLCARARHVAETEYGLALQARRYEEIYRAVTYGASAQP